MPAERVTTLEEEELFPPDPKSHELEMPKFDQIEGLSVHMTPKLWTISNIRNASALCVVCLTTL